MVSVAADTDPALFTVTKHLSDDDFRLSVEESGRVVRVADTTVFATAADFTIWRLSGLAVAEFVRLIEGSPLFGHPERNRQFGIVTARPGYTIGYRGRSPLQLVGPVEVDGLTDEQVERRRQFHELFDRLSDHEWLADELVSGPEPYIPETLIVSAAVASSPVTARWPLATTPDEPFAAGGDRLCLIGDEAAALWEAMGDPPSQRDGG